MVDTKKECMIAVSEKKGWIIALSDLRHMDKFN